MGQAEDRLLDVMSRIRKACIALSDAAEDREWDRLERDLMAAKADGLAMAMTFLADELRETKERRVY